MTVLINGGKLGNDRTITLTLPTMYTPPPGGATKPLEVRI